MVADILVDALVDDGRALLADLHRHGFGVAAAAWLHEAEYNRWKLYLVLPDPRGGRMDDALDRVYDSLKLRPSSELRFDQVRFVWSDEPLGEALRDLTKRFANRLPRMMTRFRSSDPSLPGYDEALLYPPAGRMTPAQVARAVADILSGGELDRPDNGIHPMVTAERNGRPLSLKPTGIRLDPSTRRLLVDHENPPGSGQLETIPADEIADIRLQ